MHLQYCTCKYTGKPLCVRPVLLWMPLASGTIIWESINMVCILHRSDYHSHGMMLLTRAQFGALRRAVSNFTVQYHKLLLIHSCTVRVTFLTLCPFICMTVRNSGLDKNEDLSCRWATCNLVLLAWSYFKLVQRSVHSQLRHGHFPPRLPIDQWNLLTKQKNLAGPGYWTWHLSSPRGSASGSILDGKW